MTDVNAAAFPQPRPTIAEILIEGFATDQTGVAMLKRIAEHYPKVTQEDFNAAMAAAQDSLAGRGGDFGHAYSRAEIACINLSYRKAHRRLLRL
jgi:hypothetical protein